MHNQHKCPIRQIQNQKSQNDDTHLNQDSLFPLFSHFNATFPVQNLLSLDFQAFTKANFWFALVISFDNFATFHRNFINVRWIGRGRCDGQSFDGWI